MIKITHTLALDDAEVKFNFIRSPGPGGQNVNKVTSAVQLRFNILHSPSLPEDVRTRLLTLLSNKITQQGELIIKASRYRSQTMNKQDALARLQALLYRAATPARARKKTKPTYSSIQRRLAEKKFRSKTKSARHSPSHFAD